jgi:hypothetical protein
VIRPSEQSEIQEQAYCDDRGRHYTFALWSLKYTVLVYNWFWKLRTTPVELEAALWVIGHHHVGVCGCGCMLPRVLNLGPRWWRVVSFTLRPLYPVGKNPLYSGILSKQVFRTLLKTALSVRCSAMSNPCFRTFIELGALMERWLLWGRTCGYKVTPLLLGSSHYLPTDELSIFWVLYLNTNVHWAGVAQSV